MTRNLRKQLHSMINRGETLINIINFLFTCDYTELEIIEMLTSDGFNCQKELLIDVLVDDFGITIER